MGWGRRRPFDVESARKCIRLLGWARDRGLLDGAQEVQTLATILSAAAQREWSGHSVDAARIAEEALSYIREHPRRSALRNELAGGWLMMWAPFNEWPRQC